MIAFPPSPPVTTTCRHRIDPARQLRIEEYQGVVGLKEMRTVAETLARDPQWAPELNGFVDLSRARLEMSASDALQLAMLLGRENHRPAGWIAYVVPDSATFGLVRMIGHWARTTARTRIFSTREEAEEWLARQAGQIPPVWEEDLNAADGTEVRIAG